MIAPRPPMPKHSANVDVAVPVSIKNQANRAKIEMTVKKNGKKCAKWASVGKSTWCAGVREALTPALY
jgi:hypothetical protein